MLGGAACLVTIVMAGCERREHAPQPSAPAANARKLEITSPAFSDGQPIPAKYTCQGEDVAPPLKWSQAPDSTRSFALICEDPDAPGGTWVHWVLYNLPPTANQLDFSAITRMEGEGLKSPDASRNPASGRNDFGRIGYGGPCPPAGPAHHYHFKAYALDTELALKPGATKQELEQAMRGHVLAEGVVIGTYARR